jgi:hypothetical protein
VDYRRLVSELNWREFGVRPVVPLVSITSNNSASGYIVFMLQERVDYRRLVSELNWIECGVRPVVPLVVPVEPVVWTRSTPARQEVASQTKYTIPKIGNKYSQKRNCAARPQSQFPHSCVCERFIHIPTTSLPILLQENMWTDPANI